MSWFLLILIGVGFVNFLPTRFWPAAILFATGQTLLLSGSLPFGAPWFAADRLVGFFFVAAAILLVACGLPKSNRSASPLDRVWLDFRDAFGALWALRVAERINAAASMYDWNLSLKWSGFQFSGDLKDEEDLPPAVLTSLNNLLRRFVSPEWIASRLGDDVDEA